MDKDRIRQLGTRAALALEFFEELIEQQKKNTIQEMMSYFRGEEKNPVFYAGKVGELHALTTLKSNIEKTIRRSNKEDEELNHAQ